MPRVLVVEDEPDIAAALDEDLTKHGYDVEVAGDGETAIRRGREAPWDAILLDLKIPGRDGFEVCRTLRSARVMTPIIMLTAKTQEAEKVLGLELGADDYVTKPFSPAELRARIKAVTRRVDRDSSGSFRFGECEVDFDRAELRRSGTPLPTTALEFRMLSAFIHARGRVLTREQLIQRAWGSGTHVSDRVVDTHVFNLRQKVEPVPAAPRYLMSVRGIGYRFDA